MSADQHRIQAHKSIDFDSRHDGGKTNVDFEQCDDGYLRVEAMGPDDYENRPPRIVVDLDGCQAMRLYDFLGRRFANAKAAAEWDVSEAESQRIRALAEQYGIGDIDSEQVAWIAKAASFVARADQQRHWEEASQLVYRDGAPAPPGPAEEWVQVIVSVFTGEQPNRSKEAQVSASPATKARLRTPLPLLSAARHTRCCRHLSGLVESARMQTGRISAQPQSPPC